MMKYSFRFFAIAIALIVCLTSCAQSKNERKLDTEVDPVLLRSGGVASTSVATSVEELVTSDSHNAILVVEFLKPGEYTRTVNTQTFVSPGLEDVTFTSCGAETLAKVLQVIKGDTDLVGQTITVGEALFQNRDGQYVSHYLSDTNLKRALICASKQGSYYAYVCSTPEHEIIPLDENDRLSIWPYLSGAEKNSTLSQFSAMAKQAMEAKERGKNEQQKSVSTVEMTQETLDVFTKLLNEPQNNFYIRSMYWDTPSMDFDDVFAGGAGRPVTQATPEEILAFEAAAGRKAEDVIKMDQQDVVDFMFDPLRLEVSCLENNLEKWYYLEEYDAWFSDDTTYPLVEIECVSGTYDEDEIGIMFLDIVYEFTKEGEPYTGKINLCCRNPGVVVSELGTQLYKPMWNVFATSNEELENLIEAAGMG